MLPEVFAPMLAATADKPFDSPDHLFEVKWDGVRTLAFCETGQTRLFSRTARDVTHQYPEFADLHSRLNVENAVFDGEIVALVNGRPSFERLQSRINLARETDIRRAVEKVPLDLVIFDAVFARDDWIGSEALQDRLEQLESCLEFSGNVIKSQAVSESGLALFSAARERGLEGIVAKRLGSHYLPGKRSRDWLKIKVALRIDCVIGGWTPGLGSRGPLGAVLVGIWSGEEFKYIGSVGSGFNDKSLADVYARLSQIEIAESPFANRVNLKGVRWARPELVCEVEYRELTSASRLRAPAFKGLRSDKRPEDCLQDF